MAAKRNSRVYVDEAKHHDENHQRQMAPTHLPRRSSWNSIPDEAISSVAELEEEHGKGSMTWEMQTGFARSSSSGKDTPPPSTSSRVSEASGTSISSASTTSDPADYPIPSPSGRPVNFGMVVPGVYRSSYPRSEDHSFLRQLELKTIVTLVKKDELDHDLEAFVADNGVHHVIFNMKGTKKEAIPMATMRSILELVLDKKNYPLLIHCNHGKHRTGCVVAVIRKLSGWNASTAVDEYRSYAEPKVRECDVNYINTFPCAPLQSMYNHHWKQPSRFGPVQVRIFFRALFFSAFVMVVFLVSGSQIPVIKQAPKT